jgi:hypothetical protein
MTMAAKGMPTTIRTAATENKAHYPLALPLQIGKAEGGESVPAHPMPSFSFGRDGNGLIHSGMGPDDKHREVFLR